MEKLSPLPARRGEDGRGVRGVEKGSSPGRSDHRVAAKAHAGEAGVKRTQ
jgi:hypothetical protein